MCNVLVIIDPRRRISVNDIGTIERHLIYSRNLYSKSNGTICKIVVLQPIKKGEEEQIVIDSTLSIFRVNFLKVIINFRKNVFHEFINFGFKPVLVVAGDPWESSWCALRFRKIGLKNGLNIPIQIQVHAEMSKNWSNASLVNRFRSMLTSRTFAKSSRIRATSASQKSLLVSRFGADESLIDVLPVPLSLISEEIMIFNEHRPFSIGFVGRIQKERDLKLFAEVCRKIASVNSELKVVIIGDGNSRESFITELKKSISFENIECLGYLNGLDLERSWAKIGVLLSTAPNESYGRSIRESLMHGIPVLARNSMGVDSLRMEAPHNWIRVLDPKMNAEELSKEFLDLQCLETTDEYLKKQNSFQVKVVEDLVSTWIEMSINP